MKDRVLGVTIGIALSAVVAGTMSWAGQTHMRDALGHLRQARASLQEATRDKGGHRENAIDLVNRAIAQVEKGIEFAVGD